MARAAAGHAGARGAAARTPVPWLAGLLALYLGVPVVAFCVRLLATTARGFHDAGLFPSLGVSALAASISTALITLLGVPLAYLLARSRSRLAGALGVAVQLPLAVPPVMAGILLIYVVGPYTTIGRLFEGALTETLAGIVLAQTFVAAPFLVVTARSAFGAVDPALGEVASALGHGEVGRFLRVAVPAAAPGIRAGMVLAWLRAFGEYGATVVLAYHPTSLPVYTFTQFSSTGLPGTVAPTALALGVAAGAVTLSRVVVVRRRRRRHGGRAAPATARRPVPAVPAPVAFELDHRIGGFHLTVAHRPGSARLAVLGPSGSGKSTLLRCLAGLLGAAAGTVSFGERPVTGVPVERRRVGYVAQGFGLFPHLRVWEQLLFATDADPAVAAYWLSHLHLDGLEARFPAELSGGQRQRVALAQALSRSPDVLLLDEPLSALDTPVRRELRRELRRLQRETGISTVVVTHDPEEAALLADEVIVITDGKAVQQGSVRTVYRFPSSPEAARLLGVRNVFEGTVAGPEVVMAGEVPVAARLANLEPGTPVVWSVRPEDVRVSVEPSAAGPAAVLFGVVSDVADLGGVEEVVVSVGPGIELEVRRAGLGDLVVGGRCVVELPADAVSVWSGGAPSAAPAPGPAAGPSAAPAAGPSVSPAAAPRC